MDEWRLGAAEDVGTGVVMEKGGYDCVSFCVEICEIEIKKFEFWIDF